MARRAVVEPLPLKGTHEPPKRAARQIGRPANVAGDETRMRILDGARECFAAYGYAATSNRLIADRTGLTSAAVYHHFGRKSHLMRAVYRATEIENQARMRASIANADGLVARVQAILDVIHKTLAEDRAQGMFMFVARAEAARHEELAGMADDRTFPDLWAEMVREAVAAGEIDSADAAQVRSVINALTSGLASLGTEMSESSHRTATEGLKRLVAGTLLSAGS